MGVAQWAKLGRFGVCPLGKNDGFAPVEQNTVLAMPFDGAGKHRIFDIPADGHVVIR